MEKRKKKGEREKERKRDIEEGSKEEGQGREGREEKKGELAS